MLSNNGGTLRELLLYPNMKLLNGSQEWIVRQSSPVDWCEENYVVTPYIAEFVNTVSNFLFLAIPPMYLTLWSSYATYVTRQVYVTLLLFFIIGLSSTYFHATLSFLGQILDELSILWMLVHCSCFYVPYSQRLSIFKNYQVIYKCFIIGIGIVVSVISFYKPEINQYSLFILGMPLVRAFGTAVKQTKRSNKGRFWGSVTITIFFVAVAIWVFDKIFCDVWRKLHITVFHGLWHILIFISSYFMTTLACYYYALQDVPQSRPELQFWPSSILGLPFVYCHQNDKFE